MSFETTSNLKQGKKVNKGKTCFWGPFYACDK